jgi:hypothetical protein
MVDRLKISKQCIDTVAGNAKLPIRTRIYHNPNPQESSMVNTLETMIGTEPELDFDIETPEAVPEQQLGQLAQLAQRAGELEEEYEALQQQADQKKLEFLRHTEKLIPDLMEQLKLQRFTTQTGMGIVVKEDIRASPGSASKNPEKLTAVCRWLRDTNNSGIIKTEVAVQFGVGEETKLQEFLDAASPIAEQYGKMLDAEVSINSQTFAAFIRERLAQGADVPEFVGVFRQKVAKIERPKD